jgi:hypothetical protein
MKTNQDGKPETSLALCTKKMFPVLVFLTTALRGCPHTGVWFCNCFYLGCTLERGVPRTAEQAEAGGDTSPPKNMKT